MHICVCALLPYLCGASRLYSPRLVSLTSLSFCLFISFCPLPQLSISPSLHSCESKSLLLTEAKLALPVVNGAEATSA